MCGFACLWQHDDERLAKRMIEKIEHRGPDETQVYRSPNVPAIMAHCRLSIIGPSDGSQPIYSADNILVANGEIYNYSDLRAILGESAFETRSDSETILHLFRSNQLRWVTQARRHVRVCACHARAGHRRARSAGHQTALCRTAG